MVCSMDFDSSLEIWQSALWHCPSCASEFKDKCEELGAPRSGVCLVWYCLFKSARKVLSSA